MSNLLNYKDQKPTVAVNVFIADNARIIGDVTIETDASIWFGAVIRADADSIIIGAGTNIQDNAVIHVDPGYPVEIGSNCIIGHSAIIHGAKLSNNVLVGMGATIMNGATIGEYSIIGANALVTSNTLIPAKSLVLGCPASIKGLVDEKGMKAIDENARVYVERSKNYHFD